MFKYRLLVALTVLGLAATVRSADDKSASAKPDADGFITLFNGKDLTGWEGLEDYWSVKDGVISGHETKDKSKQTFLVCTGGKVSDFELHLKYKFATPDGNSGIQFRSKSSIPRPSASAATRPTSTPRPVTTAPSTTRPASPAAAAP